MKLNQIIKKQDCIKGENLIELDELIPIGKISFNKDETFEDIKLSYDNKEYFDYELNHTAKYIKINCNIECEVTIFVGIGYTAIENKEWTDLFHRKHDWCGGDGIFSFNLNDGYDGPIKNEDTLFFFGDTLINTVSSDDRRIEPVVMVNNSLAYLKDAEAKQENISFYIKKGKLNNYESIFTPDYAKHYKGYTLQNTVRYDLRNVYEPYLSEAFPKEDLLLTYDLQGNFDLDHIKVTNFHMKDMDKYSVTISEEDYSSLNSFEKRGIKQVEILVGDELDNLTSLGVHELDIAKASENYLNETIININTVCRYLVLKVKAIPNIGNYGGVDEFDQFYGLSKIKFFTKDRMLSDIIATENNCLFKTKGDGWFWLQDGIVLNNNLYSLPLYVLPDASKPEGFQFKVDGIAMIKMPIVDGKLDVNNISQKETQLFQETNSNIFSFGCSFMNNSKWINEISGDDYIYVYGYTNNIIEYDLGPRLRVARFKAEDIENINNWMYFTEDGWDYDLTKSKALLDHISHEMSVSVIRSGINKGKYIAVFHDTPKSACIAYSISDTPYGPFGSINRVYKTTETEDIVDTVYTYNSKAHPHLSDKNILVSYNVNTWKFSDNLKYATVYRPRFIELIDTTGE